MLFNTYEPWKFAFSSESSDLDEIDVDVEFNKSRSWGIIGVPFDSTCSYHHGSRYGPTIIREASFGFEQYNVAFDKLLDAEFYDFGDLNIIHGNCAKTADLLKECVNELVGANIKPIIIGGEHSISIGPIKALADNEESGDLSDITIIHLDAHRDIIDEYMGEKDSHATIMRRVYDLNPKELIQIGIRSFSNEEKEFIDSKDNITTFLAKDLNSIDEDNNAYYELVDTLADIEGKIYITIDMDVIDPVYAPSVGNPTFGGLSPEDVEIIFETLHNSFVEDKIDVLGFDVVEVASNKLGDSTAILAAKFIHDFLTLFG
ncbi:MAG: agmatinase [archaeon]|nr:agmatinase [archaeon]